MLNKSIGSYTVLVILSILLIVGSVNPFCQARKTNQFIESIDGPIKDALTYVYAISHWVGNKITHGLNSILPPDWGVNLSNPKLADAIGVMVMLTLFLALAEIAKKITWLLVLGGWFLILVRLVWSIGGGFVN